MAEAPSKGIASPPWTLVWSDEFNESKLDRTKWTPEQSCWGGGNNEKQCYTDRAENFQISGGVLKIIAKPEVFSGYEFPQDLKTRGEIVTRNFTSAKLRTKGKAEWQYGRFEARIKLPQGQSTWPAFWMLPADDAYGPWPTSGEIDVMEAANLGAVCTDCQGSETENRTFGAVHFGNAWPQNKYISKSTAMPMPVTEFNTFALEWEPGHLTWFLNDKAFFSVTAKEWTVENPDTKMHATAPFDKPFYLNVNLAVGGNFSNQSNEGIFNPKSFPAEMHLDWVRVYKSPMTLPSVQRSAVAR